MDPKGHQEGRENQGGRHTNMTTGATPQERLEWLKANQPNNLEAITALERRLGVHGEAIMEPSRKPNMKVMVNRAEPNPNAARSHGPLDTDFYTRLKALHAKTGQTVYQCCVKLGLQGGQNWQPMSEAERMVCTLTNEGKILWNGSEPVFQ